LSNYGIDLNNHTYFTCRRRGENHLKLTHAFAKSRSRILVKTVFNVIISILWVGKLTAKKRRYLHYYFCQVSTFYHHSITIV